MAGLRREIFQHYRILIIQYVAVENGGAFLIVRSITFRIEIQEEKVKR